MFIYGSAGSQISSGLVSQPVTRTIELCEKAEFEIAEQQFDIARKHITEAKGISLSEGSRFDYGIALKTAGLFYFSIEEYDSALMHLLKSNEILDDYSEWEQLEDSYRLTYYIYEAKNDFRKALQYSFMAQRISDKAPGKIHNCYCSIGYFYQRLNKLDSAEYYFQKCLDYRKKYKLHQKVLEAYGNLQYLYRIKTLYQEELELTREKVKYCIQSGDDFELSSALRSEASLLYNMDDSSAIPIFFKALKVAEQSSNYRIMARVNQDLGDYNVNHLNFERAIPFYEKAIQICKEHKLLRSGAYAEQAISNCYIELQEFEKAKQHLDNALAFNDSSGYQHQRPYILDSYTEYFRRKNNYERALDYNLQALTLARNFNNIQKELSILCSRVEILLDMKAYRKADQVINSLLDNSKFQDIPFYQQSISNLQYQRFKQKKQYKEALTALEALRDTELKKEKSDLLFKIQNLNIIHQTEKKEQENRLLQAEKEILDDKVRIQNIFVIAAFIIIVVISIFLFILYRIKNELYESSLLLKQQHAKIKALNDAKDQFFSIISHDLRGPIGNICSFSQLLIDDSDSKDCQRRKQFIEIINKQSQAVLESLTNLIDWVRTQRDNLKLKPISQNICEPVNAVKAFLSTQLETKQITLVDDISTNHMACFDRSMIEVVLRNIISNAIKFSKEKGKVQILSVLNDSGLTICVKDWGMGIEPDRLEKLFDPSNFESTYGTNKESGTGLGLKICKEFVERNNGHIWVESELGKGSSFCFSLPVKEWAE